MLAQAAWAALLVAQVLVLFFTYRLVQQRRTTVPILPEFQAPLSELSTATANIAKAFADLKAKADAAPSAQDIADTLAAVQAKADETNALAQAVAPQNVSPPVIG